MDHTRPMESWTFNYVRQGLRSGAISVSEAVEWLDLWNSGTSRSDWFTWEELTEGIGDN